MQEILNKYTQAKDNLIQILNEVQDYYGYVPEKAQLAISEYLSIPMAEIYGVITFYSRFTLKPKGKYHIAVCLGTACFVKGSEKVLDRVKERLGIDVGETTKDGKFSLEATRCIGACGLAPVLINSSGAPWTADYVTVTGDLVADLLSNIASEQRAKVVYEYLYRQIDDKKVKETIDFLLNREEAHNAMFREAFNKVQNTGSNRDFGTTKAAKMYFSMSEPSPAGNAFAKTDVKPPMFN